MRPADCHAVKHARSHARTIGSSMACRTDSDRSSIRSTTAGTVGVCAHDGLHWLTGRSSEASQNGHRHHGSIRRAEWFRRFGPSARNASINFTKQSLHAKPRCDRGEGNRRSGAPGVCVWPTCRTFCFSQVTLVGGTVDGGRVIWRIIYGATCDGSLGASLPSWFCFPKTDRPRIRRKVTPRVGVHHLRLAGHAAYTPWMIINFTAHYWPTTKQGRPPWIGLQFRLRFRGA